MIKVRIRSFIFKIQKNYQNSISVEPKKNRQKKCKNLRFIRYGSSREESSKVSL